MPIVAYDPEDWSHSNVVQVDSDAPNNQDAIDDIEEWATDNGFARVNESWLRQIFRNNQRLFRGVCYRLTQEEQESSSSICRANEEALSSLPETVHHVDRDR